MSQKVARLGPDNKYSIGVGWQKNKQKKKSGTTKLDVLLSTT
jgi:hypothetical protein